MCSCAVYVLQARHAEAAAVINKAIGISPTEADLHNNLAAVLLKTGDSAGAVKALQKAVSLAPGYAKARYGRSMRSQHDNHQIVLLSPVLSIAIAIAQHSFFFIAALISPPFCTRRAKCLPQSRTTSSRCVQIQDTPAPTTTMQRHCRRWAGLRRRQPHGRARRVGDKNKQVGARAPSWDLITQLNLRIAVCFVHCTFKTPVLHILHHAATCMCMCLLCACKAVVRRV